MNARAAGEEGPAWRARPGRSARAGPSATVCRSADRGLREDRDAEPARGAVARARPDRDASNAIRARTPARVEDRADAGPAREADVCSLISSLRAWPARERCGGPRRHDRVSSVSRPCGQTARTPRVSACTRARWGRPLTVRSVFVHAVGARGRAAGWALYLPEDWCAERQRRRRRGSPLQVEIKTMPQLGIDWSSALRLQVLTAPVPVITLRGEHLAARSPRSSAAIRAVGWTATKMFEPHACAVPPRTRTQRRAPFRPRPDRSRADRRAVRRSEPTARDGQLPRRTRRRSVTSSCISCASRRTRLARRQHERWREASRHHARND